MLDTMCRRIYASITEHKEQYPPQKRFKDILSVDRLFHCRAHSILAQNAWHWPSQAGRALLLMTPAPSFTQQTGGICWLKIWKPVWCPRPVALEVS